MYKIFIVAAFLASASAGEQATSFVSFNNNHNQIHHIQSAPTPSYAKYSAPAPAHTTYEAAPAITKVVFPVAQPASSYHHVQAAPEYHVSAAPTYHFQAPTVAVSKVAIPVAKVAVPVAKYVAAAPSSHEEHKEEYAPAQYEFAYVIEDSHTGDHHSQQEHRDGDHVVGQYSLHEADGTVRVVKYSDDGHGFNAVVERQGKPTEAPVYKKLVAIPAGHHY